MIGQQKRNEIEKFAANLRAALGLQKPPYDPEEAIKKLGGEIDWALSFFEEADGLIAKTGPNSFRISLNASKRKNIPRKRFTLAHEIGHLFLHMGFIIQPDKWKNLNTYNELVKFRDASNKRVEEYEANQFAAAFLMPKEEFVSQVNKNSVGQTCNVPPIADYFNVSIEAAEYRGRFLGLFQW